MTKIAVIQFKASTDKSQNLRRIVDLIRKSASRGADLCAFPEFMMFYTTSQQSPRDLALQAETIDGNFVRTVALAAKKNTIEVVGTIYEKSKKKDRVYDTSFLVDKSGTVRSTYRKIHLYDALGFKE
jgi:predicted amidohydrolase